MRVLMILASTPDPPPASTARAVQLGAFAASLYRFVDAGAEVTLASPRGGGTPFAWPRSTDPVGPSVARLRADRQARDQLGDTVPLTRVFAEDFNLAFYPGECPTHPTAMWDMARDPGSRTLIDSLWSRTPLAFVGTAAAALLEVRDEAGAPRLAGRRVTGVTATEERALSDIGDGLTVEGALRACGAIYSRAADWAPHVVTDGLLVSGQNAASAGLTAERVLALAARRR